MAKIRDSYAYLESGDEGFEDGVKLDKVQKIKDFCVEVLDKTFDNWLLIGRDFDPKNYKEVEGGKLMSGMILGNFDPQDEQPKFNGKTNVKNIDGKANFAMMVLDAIEGVCENENETEAFLDSLSIAAKRNHKRQKTQKDEINKVEGMDDDGKSIEYDYDDKEELKIDILEDLLIDGIEIFDSYKSKERFLRSCLSSLVVARILSSDDEDAKARLRESMRASVAGDREGGRLANRSIEGIDNWVTTLLDAIDDGKSMEEIQEMLKTFNNNL